MRFEKFDGFVRVGRFENMKACVLELVHYIQPDEGFVFND